MSPMSKIWQKCIANIQWQWCNIIPVKVVMIESSKSWWLAQSVAFIEYNNENDSYAQIVSNSTMFYVFTGLVRNKPKDIFWTCTCRLFVHRKK